ncbi:MAG: caspase family protein [Pseudorhodoplanes sp.]
MSRIGCFILTLLALLFFVSPAFAERRVALAIGNASYTSVSPLKNPINDASGVAQTLRDLGFEVTLVTDLDKANFEQKVQAFANSLPGASAAVFYYAGHGMQVDGRNYLVPVDAKINDEADLPFELVSIDIVLNRLAHHRITNIVILDACRDNPLGDVLSKKLGDRAKAVARGLAPVSAGYSSVVSFSTRENQTALDGDGNHSPYSESLIRNIPAENVEVLDMLRRVSRDVMNATSKEQEPWITFSLVDRFFFKPGAGGAVVQDDRNTPDRNTRDRDGKQGVIQNGKPPVQPCDVVAGSASDPERVTDGKSFGELNGKEGVAACRAALVTYPNTPRFEFQLARSLHKAEQYNEAAALYRSLVQRGYFAALTNYGWMLHNGHGLPKDQKESVRLYLLAAQQGDNFGMFNSAMAYDSGEGLPYNPVQAAHWIYAALRLGHGYSIEQMSGQASGWTRDFRVELQRLLRRAGAYNGPVDGNFGPDVARAVRMVHTLPFAPTPGGEIPKQRFDPKSIPVNSPPPR